MLKDSYSFLNNNNNSNSNNNSNNNNNSNKSSISSVFINILPSKKSSDDEVTNNNNNNNNNNSWWGTSSSNQQTNNDSNICGLSYTQRMAMFVLSVLGGMCMLCLSMMYLPRILIARPGKFAMSYSLANVLLMCSSCFLVGPRNQFNAMFNGNRGVASIVYITSMIGTIYCVWKIRIMFVVVGMILIQIGALLWYIASYVPWGRSALSNTSSFMFRKSLGAFT